MVEEIFGPILPILSYKDFEGEVLPYINKNEKPLSLYYFGNNKTHSDLLEKNTSSGAFVSNDTVMHITNGELPFGGVGNAGYGSLHG